MKLSQERTPRYFDHIFAWCKTGANWDGRPLYGDVLGRDHYGKAGFSLNAGFADGGMPGIFWDRFNVCFSSRRVKR